MRHPGAPIPSPDPATGRADGYWQRVHPRPPPVPRPDAVSAERRSSARDRPHVGLPGHSEDTLGIDRRRHPRSAAPGRDPETLDDVVFAAHVPWRGALLGLVCAHGSAWLETISVCPTGVLARAFDPLDPTDATAVDRGPQARVQLRATMRTLLPAMCRGAASPLVATGVNLLSTRLAADLGAWAQRADQPTEVTLLRVQPGTTVSVERVVGHASPLTDPTPGILAIALPQDATTRWMALAAASR